jgi:hypothetical protein
MISMTKTLLNRMCISPSIKFIIHHDICLCRTMSDLKIFFNPSHQIIFEDFHYLMKQIWCHKLMDICSWECCCKGLNIPIEIACIIVLFQEYFPYQYIRHNTPISPCLFFCKCFFYLIHNVLRSPVLLALPI